MAEEHRIGRSGYLCLHRFIVPAETLPRIRAACEPTEGHAWIGAKGNPEGSQRLRRHVLRGVPGRRIDLLLPDGWEDAAVLAVEIGRKRGRYDGAERTQVVLRRWSRAGAPLPHGSLRATEEEDCVEAQADGAEEPQMARHVVLCAVWHARQHAASRRTIELAGGSWIEAHRMLTSALARDGLRAIVLWHWRRYYSACVRAADTDSVIAEFEAEMAMPAASAFTLSEANRLASRLLYRAAVQSGWRKLTLRERVGLGYGADGPQWVERDRVALRMADMGYGTSTGAGQYSTEAAQGRAMRLGDRDDQVATSYGVTAVEG